MYARDWFRLGRLGCRTSPPSAAAKVEMAHEVRNREEMRLRNAKSCRPEDGNKRTERLGFSSRRLSADPPPPGGLMLPRSGSQLDKVTNVFQRTVCAKTRGRSDGLGRDDVDRGVLAGRARWGGSDAPDGDVGPWCSVRWRRPNCSR